ncbi:MAG: 7-cyano-7-deazaguanine synthase QueC [Syntrophobacterales bacterium]|jgi:7-cyano-7-deazaguanine synthase|nr:7-cyano-7-deazaguanine synthase QueC [Syntrophobacterales bacterium]
MDDTGRIGTKCLVVLSGGQDSTTCLYWAKERFHEVYTVAFDYGQRHRIELTSAETVAGFAHASAHETIDITGLMKSTSPLIDKAAHVARYDSAENLPGGIEPTFIPCRNLLFLTIAANRAVVHGIRDLVIGVSEVDYGGYPDCRSEFIRVTEDALRLGLEMEMTIHAPLIRMSKKETVLLSLALTGCMEALAWSHTCYMGATPPCGKCHACLLREKGFQEAGVEDPLIRRLRNP